MRKLQVTLLATLAIVSTLLFIVKPQTEDNSDNEAASTTNSSTEAHYSGLPWQITFDPSGNLQVFNLTLGVSTLKDAEEILGIERELALIEAQNEESTTTGVEMYYAYFKAGPLKGRLILVADISQEERRAIRERALNADYLETGNKKFHLSPEDEKLALNTAIKAMTFIPAINLDESIIENRFGKTESITKVNDETKIFHYPKQGLNIVFNKNGKEALEYFQPILFSR